MNAPSLRRWLAPLYAPRWRPAPPRAPGYSVLLMVPADVPVFARLATLTCAGQRADRRREVLLVPDGWNYDFAQAWERLSREGHLPDLRLVRLGRRDRQLLRAARNPHLNCWLQFLRGAEVARATHLLWHDADLFLTNPEFMEEHYACASAGGLAVLGVEPPWDPWLAERGHEHVVATWEALFEVAWLRQTPPWQLRGHEAELDGERHDFDLTFLAQCRTPAERVGRRPEATGFVHFNYVVCTYRFYQARRGPFEDEHFRLLLIRLLEQCFPAYKGSEIPPLRVLAGGIRGQGPVTYVRSETALGYAAFRRKLDELLALPLFEARAGEVLEAIEPFERAFGS